MDEQSRLSLEQEIKSAEDVIKKLETFTTELVKKPDNILTHLCDGLETFLGFNPSSKGYDGTGIVYSDLDRLCDAVMGFLSGVLSAVKDDPSVKTYTFITERDLNKILDNMHNGVYGFGVCIDHVKRILRDYVAELHKRTDAVINPIDHLKKQITADKNKIHEEKYNALNKQVGDWEARATAYIGNVKQADEALKQLDPTLSGTLTTNIKMLLQATRTFKEAAGNDDLQIVHAVAYDKLVKVTEYLANRFEGRMKGLVNVLRVEINTLHRKLEEFNSTHFYDLKTFINNELNSAFQTVNRGIESLQRSYQDKVVGGLSIIIGSAVALKQAVQRDKQALTQQVTDFNEKITALESIGDTVRDTVPKTNLSDFRNGEWDVSRAIDGVTVKIQSGVGDYITDAVMKVKHAASVASFVDGGKVGISNLIGQLGGETFKELRSLLTNAKGNDIGEKVEYLLSWLKGKKLHEQSTESLTEALTKDLGKQATNSNVKYAIFTLLKTAANAAISKVQMNVDNFVAEKLHKIRDALTRLQTRTDQRTITAMAQPESTLYSTAAALEMQIQEFLETKVGKTGSEPIQDTVYNDLNELHAHIMSLCKQVEQAKEKMTDVYGKLEGFAGEIYKAFNEVPREARRIVSSLHEEVNDQILNGFSQVQNEVERLYIQRKQSEVIALVKIVDAQLLEMQKVIQKDKRNGLKGLLRWMSDAKYPDEGNSTMLTTLRNAIPQSGEKGAAPQQNLENHKKLQKMLHIFRAYGDMIFEYICSQFKTPGKPMKPTEQSTKIANIKNSFDTLLSYILNSNIICHFDTVSTKYLCELIDSIHSLTPTLSSAASALDPQALPDAGRPVLNALKEAMLGFVGELGKGYVNRYDGHKDVIDMNQLVTVKDGKVDGLTDNGRNLSKVFLTSLEIMFHDLDWLRKECKVNWQHEQTCIQNAKNSYQDLGKFLEHCGFGVPSKAGKQDNELKWKDGWTGKQLRDALLIKEHNSASNTNKFKLTSDDDEKDADDDIHDATDELKSPPNYSVLMKLIGHLKHYYQVCHYATVSSNKYPSNISQMLTWFSGLPHSPVYQDLSLNGFPALFEKPDKSDSDDNTRESLTLLDETADSLPAYPETITATGLSDTLTAVCGNAHSVLTAILGHGHAGGTYAVDYNTNVDKFAYPSDMNSLICTMFEIAKRLQHQLYFLYRQCDLTANFGGWRDCLYGREIGGSAWCCNTLLCPGQIGDQKGNQIHKQTCNQNCRQTAECGLKSPLQSFLEDGLPGFLPHSLKFEKGKFECSIKHSNMPCKTPMGFGDISEKASHRQKGRHIYLSLSDFCSGAWSPLSKLCGQLNCVLPSAPKTLDDMFGFYYNLITGWGKRGNAVFTNAVNAANFERDDAKLEIITMFSSMEHKIDAKVPHITGDLYSLVKCNGTSSSSPSHPCGPYLRPLCSYSCTMFAEEHADKYLSWVVYITEMFHKLLKDLYDECCKNCDSPTAKCRISKCDKSCKATALPDGDGSTHNESCRTIADCKLMRPTLFKYGFVHRDIKSLAEWSNECKSKRTCKDFCAALKHVINEEEKVGAALAKLIYRTIPEYLLEIRKPFMLLTLALWLLSFLYLLHIMVIRLDLLHIKSHLHSPSSHRIAAQSLLAAARVNKINRVFYLQP